MFYLFTSLYPLMSVLVFLVPFSPVVRLIGRATKSDFTFPGPYDLSPGRPVARVHRRCDVITLVDMRLSVVVRSYSYVLGDTVTHTPDTARTERGTRRRRPWEYR